MDLGKQPGTSDCCPYYRCGQIFPIQYENLKMFIGHEEFSNEIVTLSFRMRQSGIQWSVV